MDLLIYRDPRESLAKCSLTPLRGKPDIRFVAYHHERRLEVVERILLHPDGQELTPADCGPGLLLIDCAWRRVQKLLRSVDGTLHHRRLPTLKTAYPRKSKTFQDPGTGLASIEALYAASVLLGDPRPDWLEGYRWQEEFLRLNPGL